MAFVFHRYGIFRPDGTCFGPGNQANTQAGWLPVPGWLHYDNGEGDAFYAYLVPMDDAMDDWLRLDAEHLHTAVNHQSRIGDPTLLRHSGGSEHPEWPHIKLGGSFTWSAPPHDHIKGTIECTRAMRDHELIIERTGLDVAI